MPKFTVQLSGQMDDLLAELAREQGIPKTQVIRRSLGLLKFLNDEQKAGNKIAVTKDDQVVKEIVPA
jgi:Ribbon-helix-helix protein, copG family